MADRQIINTATPIGRGRISAPLNLSRAPLGSGPGAVRGGNPTPNASMTARGGFQIQSGADVLRSARSAGMTTAPVAASMSSLRAMHKAGYLGSGAGVANMTRKAEASRVGPAGIGIVIDLSDMNNLANRFARIAIGFQRDHAIISRALNDGARVYRTNLKRKLQAWTGLRDQGRIVKAFRITWSTPGTLAATITVADRHLRVTPGYFGASWSRANPGGTHSAWNRRQLAPGTFMIPGKQPLFKREGRSRFPIAPLWGPALPREVERHRAEVEGEVAGIVRMRVLATAERLLAMEIARASG